MRTLWFRHLWLGACLGVLFKKLLAKVLYIFCYVQALRIDFW